MNRNRLVAYIAGGGVTVLLVGLLMWGLTPRPSSPGSQPTKLKIGIIPITDCSQLYVAKHTGVFARHGLDVEFVPMAGGAAILQGLSSGSIDVAFSNLASVVFYEKNAGALQRLNGGTAMSAKYSEAGLVVRADSGIGDLLGLRGKTIAVNSLRNIVDLAVVRALRMRGVPATEFRLVELPFKDMEAALRGDRIDAATLPEPILTRAMSAEGLKNLGDHFVLAFGEMYSTGYFTLPNRFAATKDTFERFNASIREATPIANAYSGEVLQAISKETKIAESDLQRAGRPQFVESVPDTALEQMRTWLREEGFDR
ncbi:MAG: ABC transporter substrate-binding protein [Planctomycetes bacterium]|nr:ABC transporter substrate-binding protein [Planctomycetota bacterium]MBI3833184.1 ABC transporter substrate-binding protein [Planctomycetota bacterium]